MGSSNSIILSLFSPPSITREALFPLKSVKIFGFYKFEKQKKGRCLNRDLNPQPSVLVHNTLDRSASLASLVKHFECSLIMK